MNKSYDRKPKFNIDDYRGKCAMHVMTEEDAKIFCKYLHIQGRKWNNGTLYIDKCCYFWNGIETIYFFNEGCFGRISCHINNYRILEFEDFDWSDFSMKKEFTKKDLKNGDVVKFRKGYTGIVILETGTIVMGERDYMPLDSTADDLTQAMGYRNDKDFDIVAVRRPNKPHECSLQAFKNNYGTLVYERKEVEEMTLEEICKALGKEIKIVKEKR